MAATRGGGIISNTGTGTLTFGDATFNSPANAAATRNIAFNGTSDIAVQGVIRDNDGTNGAGVVTLTKAGTNTLTLSGANTYSGTTTVSAGTLQIGNGGGTGTLGTGETINNATLDFNRSATYSYAGTISGTGAITYSNGVGVDFTHDDVIAGAETIAADGGITVTGDGDVTLNAQITGNTSITHSGTGTLSLGGGAVDNDFVGTILVDGGGTLQNARTGNTINSLGNTANTLTIRNGSTFDVNASTIDASLKAYSTGSFVFEDGTTLTHTGGGTARSVFADELDFAGDVTLAGNGRLDIDGTINVSGTDITITMTNSSGNVIGGNNSAQSIGLWLVQSGSTLFYSAANNLGNNADVRVESGGIFRANGGANWTTSNDLFLEAGSSLTKRDTNRTVTLDGTITVEGACTVSLSSEIWGLNGILTDAGDLTIQDTGSLRIGSSFDDSGYTGAMIFSDTGNNKQIQFTEAAASATVSADITISETTAGNFDLDITDAGSTLTLSGDISGSGAAGITKLSAGTAVLSGTNAYTGVTTISAGTLQLGSGGTTGALTGTGTITNDAALIVNRSNAFTQATDLNGEAIGGTGTLTQAGAGTTTLSLANPYTPHLHSRPFA